jgi:hypothetical protein
MDHAHNEYCGMLLTLDTYEYTSWVGTAVREYALNYPGKRHSEPHVIGQLEQCLYETESVTPMAHMNAGCSLMGYTGTS